MGQACRRVPRGRMPCRRDHSGEWHGSKAPAGDSRDGKEQFGELHTALIIAMGKTMPKPPTRDKAVTESPCQKVSRWRQPGQRAPRGRTPCRRDNSRGCHDSENPAGEFRDGEDHFWRVARCMRSSRRVPRWSRQLPERPHTRSPAVEESITENPSRESDNGEDHVTGTIQR